MFKKVLSKLFSGSKAEPAPPPSARGAGSKPAPAPEPEPKPQAKPSGKTEPQTGAKSKDKGKATAPVPAEKPAPAAAGKPKALVEWEQKSAKSVEKGADPKVLCGITDAMSREEIRDHLAMLYRRHNRAASSLDATLRAEAEIMLNAIVTCRDKLLK